jgi:hypothetical protein
MRIHFIAGEQNIHRRSHLGLNVAAGFDALSEKLSLGVGRTRCRSGDRCRMGVNRHISALSGELRAWRCG